MQVVPNFSVLASNSLEKNAYQAFQWSKNFFGVFHKFASTRAGLAITDTSTAVQQLFEGKIPELNRSSSQVASPRTLGVVRQRFERILEVDWQDAENGLYPKTLLFDNPWQDFFRFYPQVWFDLPGIWSRVQRKKYQEFDPAIDTDHYPKYYLQNFHHQTNGYLSDRSAELYDLQVELLFGGSADIMRRRVIRPIIDTVGLPDKSTRILDVACGTGRTLRMLRGAFPEAKLFGTDLSPAYLRKANQLLSELPGELPQLLQANAEELPFADEAFDIVTSVFLFHELPGEARQNVINEAARVLKPGGLIVICDSIQMDDSPELNELMDSFDTTFHEPYYRDYIRDDLGQRLQTAGCKMLDTEVHFMSRYNIARKPA
ncbi:MAG: class I SAM-dependent methyltransferase [Cyanobacteria bacterium P01_G01_bin.4]